MVRNFEELLTDHPDTCCEVEPKDYPSYLNYPKERKPISTIMQCLFSLMVQINSSESYKLGMISEEEYRKSLSEQHDQFERIKEDLDLD